MMVKILTDAILINLSFILAYYLRFKILLFITPPSFPVFEQYLRILVFVTLLWLAVFKLVGLYEEKKFTALIDEIALIFWGITLSSLLLLGLLFLYRELWFSRLVIANAWWISLVLMGLSRVVIFEAVRLLHSYGIGTKNVLILAAGEIGQTLAEKMLQDKGLGYRPIGFLDQDGSKYGKIFHGIPVLGDFSKISEIITQKKVGEIIVADPALSAEKILDLITSCERLGVEFKLVPGILELIATRVDADELAGVPLLTVSEIKLKGFNAFIKRIIDLVFSLIGLILFSPLFLIVAILIKITSPGPVFFIQDRVGLDGNIFKMFKFRSMIKDADKL
ncbi:MAG: sugar transferase, partial [Candidatus Margulisiibacteriota bacterium]